MIYTPFIWPLILAALVLTGLAVYTRRFSSTLAAIHFRSLVWLGAASAVIYLHEISVVSLPFKVFLSEARYIPLALISPALFVLVLDYTGKGSWLHSRRGLLIYLVPAITILLSLTGNYHHLFRYDFRLNPTTVVPALLFQLGPLWDIYYLYSLALVFGACGLLLGSLNRPNLNRFNTLALIAGILIPIGVDLLFVLGLTPVRGFYWTPIAFMFTGVAFGWALLREHLFELTPIARNTVLENISDLALVLDLGGRLVDFNRSARQTWRLSKSSVGLTPLQALLPEWAPPLQQQAALFSAGQPGPDGGKAEVQIGVGDGRRVYELTISPVTDSRQRRLGRLLLFHDITAHKQLETQLQQNQERLRSKLDHLLSPDYDLQAAELEHIIDSQAIQALMDDFYRLTQIGVAIMDLKGQLLVATGWQDICTKFHRQQPETLQKCLKSDLELSRRVNPGVFQLYKCQNHLNDIVTPIVVGERHVGNLYLGQFFYEDETIDRELFARQAEQYGFNKEEYLAALERVPRWSREKVEQAMSFYARFAALVSQLSYSNLTLAQMLANEEKTQAALRESEQRYRLLAENVRDVIWTMDKDYHFTYISPSIRSLRGLEPEEALQESLEDTMTPESFQEVVKAGQARVAAEAAGNYEGVTRVEVQQKRKDGSLVWVDVQVQDLYDEQGQCIGKFGVSRDISQRKQAELALAAEQALLQNLLDNLPDQVYFKDLESRFIRINQAQANLFKLSDPAQALGKIDFDFFAEAHARPAFDDEQRIIQTGEPLVGKEEQEIWLDHADTWASTTKMPLRDPHGKITGTFGVSRDITARKQAELALAAEQALLQELLDNLPDTIYFKDLESRFIRVNQAQAARLGITDPAQAIGKTDFDFFTDDFAKASYADEQRIIQTGQPLINYAERERWLNRRPDTWVSSTKMPRRDPAGKITGTFGVSRDITAQKQAEQQLKAALEQKEILLKEIHHRVKNNLAVISSLLDMQATASKDERLRSAFQDSQRRILAMARIHEQLYQSHDLEHIDMAHYLAAFTVDLQSYDVLSNTQVRVDVQDVILGIDQAIPCGLIINELVTNALKYAFSGLNGDRGDGWKPDILVSMRRRKTKICLIVSDNGVGLPAGLDLERPQRLGLRLVTRLTNQLQGQLETESSAENGTIFKITFTTL